MKPSGEQIRVRGLVQGVGFRPTVWRLARDLGLAGDVRNDGTGVLVRLWGDAVARDAFCERLVAECPPLARIRSLERTVLRVPAESSGALPSTVKQYVTHSHGRSLTAPFTLLTARPSSVSS